MDDKVTTLEVEEREISGSFGAGAAINAAGEFEILAITAGVGNGWEFDPVVLHESLALWTGAQVFIDHAMGITRSVRDLAGVLESVDWDPEAKGIRARLATTGPSGPVLEDLGRRYLSTRPDSRPKVGFSADVVFMASGNKVVKIVRVNSLDLVYKPARGGQFVRALNGELEARSNFLTEARSSLLTANQKDVEVFSMAEKVDGVVEAQFQDDLAAARTLLAVQQEKEKLAKAAEAAREIRLQMCGYLLESGLASSRLPSAMQDHVRQQFAGKVFEAGDLTAALDSARTLVGQLQAGSIVSGPGRISGMFSSADQVAAAVADLFEVEREKGSENLKVARLSGIRELYLMCTGDVDLHGGYDSSRAQLATTADFTGLVKNALNKIVINTWDTMGQAGYNWWEPIIQREHFETLNDVTGILVGTVGDLPQVLEGAEYTELPIGDSPEVASFKKYGGYVPLTLN